VSVNVAAAVAPAGPSATVTSAADTTGGASSSAMVAVAAASAAVAFTTFDNRTSNVSPPGSNTPSPSTRTEIVLLVSPGAKVSEPDAAS
jgi:hypothetical protein